MSSSRDARSRILGSIAYFGGTFDPPHIGHATALQELAASGNFQEIWCEPAYSPSQKASATPYSTRMQWTEAFVRELQLKNVKCLGFEEKIEARYTVQILEHAKTQGIPFTFVMGTDQVLNWETWRAFPEILGLCHWWILNRKGSPEKQVHELFLKWQSQGLIHSTDDSSVFETRLGSKPTSILWAQTQAPDINSTDLRSKKERHPKNTNLSHEDFRELTPKVFELWKTL